MAVSVANNHKTRRRRSHTAVFLAQLAILLSACGGGGSENPAPQSAVPATNPVAPSEPSSAPPTGSQPNRQPVIARPIGQVRGVASHSFIFDATQGGTTFVDPDGDPLTYTIARPHWNGEGTFNFEPGSVISATLPPFEMSTYSYLTASDGRGGTTTETFVIVVAANASPVVANPNAEFFTARGVHVNRDLTQGGTTFRDADGDVLTYTVEMTSPPGRGFALAGTSAVGALTNSDLASFKITARDGYGGVAADTFIIANPAPLPGPPTRPLDGYAYADDDLALPWDFRDSRASLAPFWDTATTQRNHTTNAGAILGRVLFYDKRLSILNTHSCGSCHEQAKGFATGDRFPTGVLGVPLKRNAMALANVRYNFSERYFGDHRVEGLERLALMPIEDPAELGNTMKVVVERLNAADFYPGLFGAAFGTPAVTPERIASALAQFLRSMLSYRTRMDLAFHPLEAPGQGPQPDPAQFLTPLELQGETLFFESNCHQCHMTGLQTMDFVRNNGLDLVQTDPGLEGEFRTASLRNIAVTAPYMHDGRFATLREVIDHYDGDVVDSPDLSPQLREGGGGPPRRLNLTAQQKDALEAFLLVLTDEALLTDPKFSDPF
jgi:cytochrome c peroxidase